MSGAVFTTRLDGPSPEVDVSKDLSKRGLIVAPVIIAVCGVIWGGDGAWSSAYAVAIVLANFLLAADDHRHHGARSRWLRCSAASCSDTSSGWA